MDLINIQYRFILDENKDEIFELSLDPVQLEPVVKIDKDLPEWTELEFHKCQNCPLIKSINPNCPVAVSLVDVVRRFDKIISFKEIRLEVKTAERCISQDTTAQRGISSLIGLLIATSGCPLTAFFKPMARFHLPLASAEETTYRATSMYLLAQYFLLHDEKTDAPDCDLTGLRMIYNNLHLVNTMIAQRLRAATKTDSSVNAIIILDMYTKAIPFRIEDTLKEIKHLFLAYDREIPKVPNII